MRFPALDKRRGSRRPGAVTAIDVDGRTLRVAQAASRGSRAVITDVLAGKLEVPDEAAPFDATVLGAAIAGALGKLRVRPGAVVMGLPRAQVLLRTVTVPLIEDARELASVVHLQIAKDLPFRLEEAVIDFKVIREVVASVRPEKDNPDRAADDADSKAENEAPVSKLEVLVAAVKRSVVEFYRQTAKEAGVKLIGLGWLSHANVRCLEACGAAEGDAGVALISLRADDVGIDFIARHSLRFSRGATVKMPLESAAAAEGEPITFAEGVAIEVMRSLHSYGGMEPQSPIAEVVVGGATGQEATESDALNRRLDLPCRVLDPAASLDLPAASRDAAPGAIAVMGLALDALDPQGLAFDFLHPKRPAVQRDTQRLRLLSGIAAVAVALAALLSVRAYLVNKRTQTYTALQIELKAAEKNRPVYKRMQQQFTTVRVWKGEGRNWLNHYAHLSAVLPRSEEVYLSSLAFGSGGTIRFAVQARSGEVLAKLDKQLRAAGYDVKPLAITPGTDRHGYNFRSTVELGVSSKMKFDFAKVRPPARPATDASLETVKKIKPKRKR